MIRRIWPSGFLFVLVVVCFGLAGASLAGVMPGEELLWEPERTSTHTVKDTGLVFDLPTLDLELSAQAFGEDTPSRQIRHSVRISRDRTEWVRVDVWRDTSGADVLAWFEEHLGFVVNKRSMLWTDRASVMEVPAVVVQQARSPPAYAQRLAVFRVGSWVLSVTCVRADIPEALETFETVVQSFRTQG